MSMSPFFNMLNISETAPERHDYSRVSIQHGKRATFTSYFTLPGLYCQQFCSSIKFSAIVNRANSLALLAVLLNNTEITDRIAHETSYFNTSTKNCLKTLKGCKSLSYRAFFGYKFYNIWRGQSLTWDIWWRR